MQQHLLRHQNLHQSARQSAAVVEISEVGEPQLVGRIAWAVATLAIQIPAPLQKAVTLGEAVTLALTTEQMVFLQCATEAPKPLSILHAKFVPELRKLTREQIADYIVQPLEAGKLVERHTYPNGKYGFRPSKLGEEALRIACAEQEELRNRPPLQITPPRRYVIGKEHYVPPQWVTR